MTGDELRETQMASGLPPRRSLSLNDLDGLVELERQHRLDRHFDRPALGQDLSQRAASCAGSGSDRGAFPTAGNGADNGAQRGSTACPFDADRMMICAFEPRGMTTLPAASTTSSATSAG